MAYTISGSPQTFTPVYNPIVFYVDSDNKNEDGFKYICDIYSSATATRIASIKVFPRPGDGLGVLNINQLLENEVSYTFPIVNNEIAAATKNIVNYDIEFGEEYYKQWAFTGTSAGPSIFSGLTLLNGTDLPPFNNGDEISISTITPSIYPTLQGFTTVAASGATQLLTNIPWINSNSGATGTIRYADGAKSLIPNVTSISGYSAFNGAVSHKDFIVYSGTQYTLAQGFPRDFLTDLPNYYPVKLSNDLYLNFHTNTFTNQPRKLFISTYDSNGNQIGELEYTTNIITPFNSDFIQYINLGPNGIANYDMTLAFSSGTTALTNINIDSYSTQFENTADIISAKYFYKINRDCFRYENIELLFQDRWGSFIPANFELQNVRTINWSQSQYNTFAGDLTNGTFNYDTYSRGSNTINTDVITELSIKSNWISEDVANYWQQLYTSPLVYIKEGGVYWPVTIKDNKRELTTKNNKKNISYTMTIQYGFKDRVQNG